MCEYGTDNVTCPNCPGTCQGRERDYQKDLEVCEKASKEPWKPDIMHDEWEPDTDCYWIDGPSYIERDDSCYFTKDDADFITLARTALPWYIKRCMALESQLQQKADQASGEGEK